MYFYSIEEQLQTGLGFSLNGATITYDAASEEIIIGQTRNWQHVATLQFSVSEADNPEIELRNTYTWSAVAVTVQKEVAGNMADREKRFDFTVSIMADGTAADFILNGTAYTGRASFSLKHGESVRFENVPVGAQLTVTEADYQGERYIPSYAIDRTETVPGGTAVIRSVTEAGHSILFTNQKDVIPDTGLRLDTLPYLLLLGVVLAGAAVAICRHSKRIGT